MMLPVYPQIVPGKRHATLFREEGVVFLCKKLYYKPYNNKNSIYFVLTFLLKYVNIDCRGLCSYPGCVLF